MVIELAVERCCVRDHFWKVNMTKCWVMISWRLDEPATISDPFLVRAYNVHLHKHGASGFTLFVGYICGRCGSVQIPWRRGA